MSAEQERDAETLYRCAEQLARAIALVAALKTQ